MYAYLITVWSLPGDGRARPHPRNPTGSVCGLRHGVKRPSLAVTPLPNPFGRIAPQYLALGADAKAFSHRLPGIEP